MRFTYVHHLEYIHWAKESRFVLLDNVEYGKKLAWIKKVGKKVKEKTNRLAWIENDPGVSYRQDKEGKYEQLYVREGGEFVRYSTNVLEGGKIENPGRDAYNAVVTKLREIQNSKRNVMSECFGHTEEDFKICIPKQFYHIEPRFLGKKVMGVCGIDFKSHYPASICGRLPDANEIITGQGQLAPTEEYPFAFYLRSGHSCEFGGYDTRKWIQSDFSFRLFEHKSGLDWNLNIQPEEDYTVLMSASKAELTDIMQYFYDIKESDKKEGEEYHIAKLVMNAFIGYLHKTKSYDKHPYAHLAAVCLCRANEKMRAQAEKIGYNNIIQICIDGCIYRSDKRYGSAKKELKMGELKQEYSDAIILIEGTNRYLIKDGSGNVIKCKLQGANYCDGEEIDSEFMPDWEDMKKLERKMVLE